MIIYQWDNVEKIPDSIRVSHQESDRRPNAVYSVSERIGEPPIFVIFRGTFPIDYDKSFPEASKKMHTYAIKFVKYYAGEYAEFEDLTYFGRKKESPSAQEVEEDSQ